MRSLVFPFFGIQGLLGSEMTSYQALALLPHVAHAVPETTTTTAAPAPIEAAVKSVKSRELSPVDRKLPPVGPPPVTGGSSHAASGPLLSQSAARKEDASNGTIHMDGSSSVFLSRWVARVSPSPSANSGTSSPDGSDESEPSPPCASDGVELVDDWGFDWGQPAGHAFPAACSTDVFDVLALLRAQTCNRSDWSSHSTGMFCPELELPV